VLTLLGAYHQTVELVPLTTVTIMLF